MNKHLSFLFILPLMVTFPLLGQDATVINRTLQDFVSKMRFGGNEQVRDNTGRNNSTVEGSEYLDDKFVEGDLITQNSERYSGVPIRYNAYNDNIEVKLPDGKIYLVADKQIISQVKFNDNILIYTKYLSTQGEKRGFLFVLYAGECLLYRRNWKEFKAGIPSNGIVSEIPSRIVDKPEEFYIRIKEKLPMIINSKKDLLWLLQDHSAEIEDFLKKENVKINDDHDLIKVLSYYDSL